MLDLIIRLALKNRLTVLIVAVIAMIYGAWTASHLPVWESRSHS